jgi:hypothetical protein
VSPIKESVVAVAVAIASDLAVVGRQKMANDP